MKVTAKLITFDKFPGNGCTIPKEVFENAILESDAEFVYVGIDESRYGIRDLKNVAGKVDEIKVDGSDIIGTFETLHTPQGIVLETILKEYGPENIHLSPYGYGERDENGNIKSFTVNSFIIIPNK